MSLQTGKQLAEACLNVARHFKTIYVMGAFGWPMNRKNQERAIGAYSYNAAPVRAAKIRGACGEVFGFDCVNLIKALLWGWAGDASANYGGAVYGANGVPDVDEGAMFRACREVSADFSRVQPGEAVWLPGHIGIYVGDGLAVECTPNWADGVQVTACNCDRPGYPRRDWAKHGHLPYVTYEQETKEECMVNIQMLRKGSRGPGVQALQVLLMGYGYSCGSWGADGDFGSATDSAVKAYQAAKKLEVDGIVGPATWQALLGCGAS